MQDIYASVRVPLPRRQRVALTRPASHESHLHAAVRARRTRRGSTGTHAYRHTTMSRHRAEPCPPRHTAVQIAFHRAFQKTPLAAAAPHAGAFSLAPPGSHGHGPSRSAARTARYVFCRLHASVWRVQKCGARRTASHARVQTPTSGITLGRPARASAVRSPAQGEARRRARTWRVRELWRAGVAVCMSIHVLLPLCCHRSQTACPIHRGRSHVDIFSAPPPAAAAPVVAASPPASPSACRTGPK